MKRPVLFLDFDDVICLNAPYGCYHAKLALDDGTFRSSSNTHDIILAHASSCIFTTGFIHIEVRLK